jgi:hypothetical protein
MSTLSRLVLLFFFVKANCEVKKLIKHDVNKSISSEENNNQNKCIFSCKTKNALF